MPSQKLEVVLEGWSDFDIKFSGLKPGHHTFNFKIGQKFFDEFEISEIEDGSISVTVALEKQSTLMVANFSMVGTANSICDRCSDPLVLEINYEDRMIYKFGDENFEDNEEVVVLTQADDKFNVAEPIYQFLILSLPSRKIHDEGECNQDVIDKIDSLSGSDEDDDIDPRWSALKDLK